MAKLFTTEFANLHSTKKSPYSAELEKRMEALRELRVGYFENNYGMIIVLFVVISCESWFLFDLSSVYF